MALIQNLIHITSLADEDMLVIRDTSEQITGRVSFGALKQSILNDIASTPPKMNTVEFTVSYVPLGAPVLYENRVIKVTDPTSATCMIPPNRYTVGAQIHFRQGGAGQISLIGATETGITSIIIPAAGSLAKTRAEGSLITAYLEKIVGGNENWVVIGDTEATP